MSRARRPGPGRRRPGRPGRRPSTCIGRPPTGCPFPELLIALGEAQEAAGRTDDAATTYQLVRDIEALFAANGVNTDLDIALFEADHGDAARGPDAGPGRRTRRHRPSGPRTRSAGRCTGTGEPAEARPYAEQALRLGSVEPGYLFHAGMIAAAQGDVPAAREWLTASLARNPAWSPLARAHRPRRHWRDCR